MPCPTHLPGPPTTDTRYPSLDLWRGIACLLVVVVYRSSVYAPVGPPDTLWGRASVGAAAVAHWLWIGVPIFFVISGYCISATADSSRRKG